MSERVFVSQTVERATGERGATVRYQAGQWYHVEPDVAEELVGQDLAYREGQEPQCPHCDAVATSQALLARHIAAQHQPPAQPAAPPAGALTCEYCGATAESPVRLAKHLASQHAAALEAPAPAPAAPTPAAPAASTQRRRRREKE